MRRPKGLIAFTLIELLIVVAIIGILAAIAIPNFRTAQVRAQVVQVIANMETIFHALDEYVLDQDVPPPHEIQKPGVWGGHTGYPMKFLTTPVAYLSSISVAIDPFLPREKEAPLGPYFTYQFTSPRVSSLHVPNTIDCWGPYTRYGLLSTGPNRGSWWGDTERYDMQTTAVFIFVLHIPGDPSHFWHNPSILLYDPTNGTVSDGDIIGLNFRSL